MLNRCNLGKNRGIPVLQHLERLVPVRGLRDPPDGGRSLMRERIVCCFDCFQCFRERSSPNVAVRIHGKIIYRHPNPDGVYLSEGTVSLELHDVDSTSCRLRDIDEAVSTAYKTIWEAEFWRRGSFARARRRAVRNITTTNIDVEFFAEANYGHGSVGIQESSGSASPFAEWSLVATNEPSGITAMLLGVLTTAGSDTVLR
jgi:hypothetical protein